MSTMNLGVPTVDLCRGLAWSEIKQNLAEWRSRACSRDDLVGLSDRVLQDIGMSRCTAEFEASKPFWMA